MPANSRWDLIRRLTVKCAEYRLTSGPKLWSTRLD